MAYVGTGTCYRTSKLEREFHPNVLFLCRVGSGLPDRALHDECLFPAVRCGLGDPEAFA